MSEEKPNTLITSRFTSPRSMMKKVAFHLPHIERDLGDEVDVSVLKSEEGLYRLC